MHLPVACRLLSFCANVAACLPFKRCDEPYSLLHLINSTISRRGAFVLSAQKQSLEPASDGPPHTTQYEAAAPDAGNGFQQDAVQSGVDQHAAHGAPAPPLSASAAGDEVSLPSVQSSIHAGFQSCSIAVGGMHQWHNRSAAAKQPNKFLMRVIN